jgi:hypothetical protein
MRVLSEENNRFLAAATLNGMRRNAYVSEDMHENFAERVGKTIR